MTIGDVSWAVHMPPEVWEAVAVKIAGRGRHDAASEILAILRAMGAPSHADVIVAVTGSRPVAPQHNKAAFSYVLTVFASFSLAWGWSITWVAGCFRTKPVEVS